MPRRALLIVNTNSRSGKQACDAAIEGLRRHGIEPYYRACGNKKDVVQLIGERGKDADMIVVGGGDGTLNTSAAGVIEARRPLGILPMGTANDLARTLGIPTDLEEAIRVVSEAHTRFIDIGSVNDQLFFNVASIGMSAELAQELTPDLKRRFGKFGYALAAVRVLLRARPFRARIAAGNRNIVSLTLQIAVGNGRYYGGGNVVTRGAAIDDGALDLYSLELVESWRLVLMLRSFRRGEHTQGAEVRDLHGTHFDVLTRRPRPVNADGEIVTHTPAVFRVLPRAIEVIAPVAQASEPIPPSPA
jgi:diacylglycerol kinase (ATP)